VAVSRPFNNLSQALSWSIVVLKNTPATVDSGHWQGVPTEGRPDLETREVLNMEWAAPIPESSELLGYEVAPNLPWAENHFLERVGRIPSNPGREYQNWPWWRGQDDDTMEGGRFTHTYQERFWPKQVGDNPNFNREWDSENLPANLKNFGIRYAWGDLDDVVSLLRRYPHTRQATFPIFFPEDTGAVHGGRIPCTLHYHFLLREGRLNIFYAIRSCDAVRHYRDDVYMASRLCQWVLSELQDGMISPPELNEHPWNEVKPGMLYFTAYSFHVHRGDAHLL
jgi:hypothetical protein